METPQLRNDLRRIPGNLLLVDGLHIGVAGLRGFDGKIIIAECQGESGETVALALTEDAAKALIEGLEGALDSMSDGTDETP